ncbi:MAG TPA: hypothetical protein VLE72_01390 [Candidatus Saccharimonadales bacterium]|nr:hypothetical protein [Candidatus Saccharimonadales bacterium]
MPKTYVQEEVSDLLDAIIAVGNELCRCRGGIDLGCEFHGLEPSLEDTADVVGTWSDRVGATDARFDRSEVAQLIKAGESIIDLLKPEQFANVAEAVALIEQWQTDPVVEAT